jgi:hypothetical protein
MKLTGKGVDIDAYRMTTVDLKELGYRDKQYILAKDVTQVFYMKDTSNKRRRTSLANQRKTS